MSYSVLTFISILLFSSVHLWAEKIKNCSSSFHARFLSFGGGVAISYVFIDLLSKLCHKDAIVREAFAGVLPFVERHVYIMALAGFLLFFIVDRTQAAVTNKRTYLLSIGSYALFNFLIGYAVADKNNPEVQPLVLFTVAMGLHYFVNDYSLTEAHGDEYDKMGKWILIVSLFLGWGLGLIMVLPKAAVALVSAFIGGGVIMNVIRHELPKSNPNSLGFFLLSAVVYTVILLMVGS